MDPASRPPLELLPDLPVEESLDAQAGAAKPPAAAPASAAATPATGATTASKDPEQSGLNFVDPELFLAAGEKPSVVPVGTAALNALPDTNEALELEDPVVDDMLTTPPPPPAPPSAPPAPAAAVAAPVAKPEAARAAARVPIARTASLDAAATKLAATKLAAASAARSVKTAPVPRSAAVLAPSVRAAPAKPAPVLKPVVPTAAAPEASPAPKVDTPSLASWAQARAAAAAVPRVSPAPPIPTIVPPAAARNGANGANGAAPKAATPAAAATPAQAVPPVPAPPMDRDFIARNQVVERYLSGRLPIKGATDFERFCHENPQLLDEIGLPGRVNAGLRLLEASGKPEPWQESARPVWQKPQVPIALASAVVILGVALAIVAGGSAGKSHRITELQRQATERALDPATSRREIRVLPSRSGASNSPAITIGGAGGAQLADFKIDESRSPYHNFRVTIDRIDQGRVGVITNLMKDSNGHLRIALNSSALGPGNYQLTLEGLDWRGESQPDSWVTIGIVR